MEELASDCFWERSQCLSGVTPAHLPHFRAGPMTRSRGRKREEERKERKALRGVEDGDGYKQNIQ